MNSRLTDTLYSKTFSFLFFEKRQNSDEKHQNFTGVFNDKILRNIEKLSRGRHAMIIRIPLIPGYNDDEENIHSTAKFLKDLPYALDVEFLPYHELGIGKYRALARKYSLTSIRSLTGEKMEKIRFIFESYTITVKRQNIFIKRSLSKGHLSN